MLWCALQETEGLWGVLEGSGGSKRLWRAVEVSKDSGWFWRVLESFRGLWKVLEGSEQLLWALDGS